MFCLYKVSGHGDSRWCDSEKRFHALQMFLTRLKVPFGLWEICYEIVILKLRKCKFRILYTQPYVSTSSMPYFVCKQSCWNIEEKSAFFLCENTAMLSRELFAWRCRVMVKWMMGRFAEWFLCTLIMCDLCYCLHYCSYPCCEVYETSKSFTGMHTAALC